MIIKLRNLLIVAFLAASSIPLVFFWLWPHSEVLQFQKEEVRERHLLIAKNLSAELELYHRDLVAAFRALSPQIAEGGGEEEKLIFENLHFRHMCVADPDTGEVLRSYLDSIHPCPDIVPEKMLTVFNDLAHDTESGDVRISNVFVPNGGLPRMFIVCRVEGVLVIGALHTTFFQEVQNRISFGKKGHAAIVDASGRALAHPRPDWVSAAKDMSMLPPVKRLLNGETGVETFYTPALDADMIAGFAPVAGVGWGVMVPQPLIELEENAKALNKAAAAVILAGMALSGLFALFVSSSVSRKVRRIESAVIEVTEGAGGIHITPDRSFVQIKELSNLEDGVKRTAAELELVETAEANWSRDIYLANEQLKVENEERKIAEEELQKSERHFRTLFENLPVPTRLEDYSAAKDAIDSLGVTDPEEFAAFIERSPEFVTETAALIEVLDVNDASMMLHGYDEKSKMKEKLPHNISDASIELLSSIFKMMHRGGGAFEFESTVRTESGNTRTMMAHWSVVTGFEETYERVVISSIDVSAYRRISKLRSD